MSGTLFSFCVLADSFWPQDVLASGWQVASPSHLLHRRAVSEMQKPVVPAWSLRPHLGERPTVFLDANREAAGLGYF
ncbi:hypothetical protein GGTG_10825 [Gaeumannomyces tritici R3-111a-1]|uniref:Uncharacterized protein n=1 Tax=Gaeumannomyces tritici (strain R3-111a-1) TaxID=644352 RepID=J3PBF2_GAET3|nr:hypothetical protein GGTG_10825 [Gaeumannomyces tritici R3-111a-1]EJT71569.1 hypothetical protein GGTG_10825 [Gaeumannomyces tritici R3-111a-1]